MENNEIKYSTKQQEFIDAVLSGKSVFLTGDAGTGKLQPLDELILTPRGYVEMRYIKEGSTVYNKYGEPIKVLKIFPGKNLNIYKVTFNDGSSVECCDDHLWEVQTPKMREKGKYTVMPLKDMIEKTLNKKNPKNSFYYSVDLPKAINFPEKQIPVHPYLLGVLIGNGYMPSKKSVVLSMSDSSYEEVFNKIKNILPPDVKIRIDKKYKSSGYCTRIIFNSEIKKYLKEVKLIDHLSKDKFIPSDYLYNSTENRIHLLNGLMDTDGCITDFGHKKKVRYSTISKKLADDVVELVRGLGGFCTKTSFDRSHSKKGIEYSISLRTDFNPFTIKSRKDVFEKYTWTHSFKKSIKNIEYVGKKDGQCLLVDDERHLYITRDYTVTHNTFIVKEAIRLLQESKKQVLVAAPTGIAANNVGGQTIHSLYSLNPNGVLTYERCNFVKKEKRRILQIADTLFFDEVSMVRSDMIDGIHWTLVKNGVTGLDRRQVIFVGDLEQLPPVADDNMKSVLRETHSGIEFHHAHIYKKMNVLEIKLDEPQRQSDPEFIEALNLVRQGKQSPYFRKFFRDEPRGIVLAPRIETVNRYNQEEFVKLPGDIYTFEGSVEILKEGSKINYADFNVEPNVRLKDGCKIMYLRNSLAFNNLRNGTLGTFRVLCDIEKKTHEFFIEVGDVRYELNREKFSKTEYVLNEITGRLELEDLATITQIPVKLAYAISIHKSQGMTLEECTIDLTQPCFVKGQLYVGLSRVKSPEGLTIIVNKHQYGNH